MRTRSSQGRTKLDWSSACLACMQPPAPPLAPGKPGQVCNPSTGVDAEEAVFHYIASLRPAWGRWDLSQEIERDGEKGGRGKEERMEGEKVFKKKPQEEKNHRGKG